MNAIDSCKRWQRRGAAFLLLVVVIVLVIIGATQTMVRSEVMARRNEASRLRVQSMAAAIDATLQRRAEPAGPIAFPIDESGREWIEVTIDQPGSQVVARWMKGDAVIDQMQTILNGNAESKE